MQLCDEPYGETKGERWLRIPVSYNFLHEGYRARTGTGSVHQLSRYFSSCDAWVETSPRVIPSVTGQCEITQTGMATSRNCVSTGVELVSSFAPSVV